MQMCKKTRVLKYKVVNTNIDKKFIGKNLDLERVKSRTSPSDSGRKLPKPIAPAWFNDFIKNRFDKLEKQVTNLRNNFNRAVKLNNLKH